MNKIKLELEQKELQSLAYKMAGHYTPDSTPEDRVLISKIISAASMHYTYRFEKRDFFENVQKVQAIKHVRAVTGLGLKEAKDTVEGVITVTLYESEADALGSSVFSCGYRLIKE
jgi:hypothetical protein